MNRIYCHVDSSNVFHSFTESRSSRGRRYSELQGAKIGFATLVDGRAFNCEELITELKQKRPDSSASSLADIIQDYYLHGDLRSLNRLNGPFAFILWDEDKKQLVAGCDSIGANRIYYSHTPKGLLCSSSLTYLVNNTPWLHREIEPDAFVQYLSLGYINAPYTIYKNVYALSPGQYLVFKNNTVNIRTFHNPIPDVWKFADTENIPEDELISRLDRLLIDSVKRRLPVGKRVAAYLSGGVDSSLVCAILRKHTDKEISVFTAGSNDPKCDEVHYAQETAEYLNIKDHYIRYMEKSDFVDAVLSLPVIYGQPFADVGAIPTYFIARKVAHNFDMVFAGDGPDGMYGVVDFRVFYYYYKLTPYQLRIPISAIGRYVASLYYKGDIAPSVHASDILGQPDFFWIFHKMFKSFELERILGKQVSPEVFWGYNFLKNRQDIPLYERLRILFQTVFIVNNVLHKSFAAHNAASVDPICPYLDRAVLDYVHFLPSKYKYRNGESRYLHKQLLYRYIPSRIIKRPKRGFRINYNEFGIQTLRELTNEYLTKKALSETGLLDADFAMECVENYYKGDSRMGSLLWALLVFEIWRKVDMNSHFPAAAPATPEPPTEV